MADTETSTAGPGKKPGPLLTYVNEVFGKSIPGAAWRGVLVAIKASVYVLVGGSVFALIGKPAYLAALWIWNHVWNF